MLIAYTAGDSKQQLISTAISAYRRNDSAAEHHRAAELSWCSLLHFWYHNLHVLAPTRWRLATADDSGLTHLWRWRVRGASEAYTDGSYVSLCLFSRLSVT